MFNTIWNADTVQQGVILFGKELPTFRQNLEQRLIDNGILVDGTNTWDVYLDSRTALLEGDYDGREAFKIEHDFDLGLIQKATTFDSGAVPITEQTYQSSAGTEFVKIMKNELKGASCDYAIRRDKYEAIKDALKNRKCQLTDFLQAGGFKINQWLTPEEAKYCDVWLELCVDKNKAGVDDYQGAKEFLGRYVDEAVAKNCFSDGFGPGLFVNTGTTQYRARLWFVSDLDDGSVAYNGLSLSGSGRFLRVQNLTVAEGDGAKKQEVIAVAPEFLNAYNQLRYGASIIESPNGTYVLTKKPVVLKQ